MVKAGSRIHNHIHWVLGDGEISFWEDIWWGDKPLSELCNPGARLTCQKVKDFWRAGVWNEYRVQRVLVPLGVPLEAVADIIKDQWSGCEIGGELETSTWKERPRKQIKMIRWIPPDTGWLKLNIEGIWSRTGAGARGVLRDDNGSLICGFKSNIVASSMTDAILQAMCIGLNMTMERGPSIWIETGDHSVVKLLTATQHGAAALRHRITEVRNRMKPINTKVSLISKEGNRVAQYLAQQGCSSAQYEVVEHFSAPHMVMSEVMVTQKMALAASFCPLKNYGRNFISVLEALMKMA
ncbi:hypothetical protein SASPL_141493 [Salvia splendens]|uniref:RNase H type-1 domain-containing protein n=1 Tax=Salvia splendens TaxID=180675 RepID=A0A8X8WQM9_SALSN|nr:hypothetical protein SASPL_141493 [Salvia splendens]